MSFAEYSARETDQHPHGVLRQDVRVNKKLHVRALKRASGTPRGITAAQTGAGTAPPGQHVRR